jgi:hypothetical protein
MHPVPPPLPEEPPATDDAIPELEYIVISYSNYLYDNFDCLFLLDSRVWYNEQGVTCICMKFRTQAIVEVLEARDLIVAVVEGFLARVNNDPILPLYIKDYPLTADNLHINIEFESFFGKYVDPLYMARVVLDCGLVYYYANNAVDPDTMVWHQRIEPYEKAYRFSMFKHMDDNLRKPLEHQFDLPYSEFSPTQSPHLPFSQLNVNNSIYDPQCPVLFPETSAFPGSSHPLDDCINYPGQICPQPCVEPETSGDFLPRRSRR